MKEKVYRGLAFSAVVLILGLIVASELPPTPLHGQANTSNTPPIVIPSNLGVWGTATVAGTGTSTLIAAPTPATIRNYLDQIQCVNVSSSALAVTIIDQPPLAAGTTLATATCPPSSANGVLTPFNPPLQFGAGDIVAIQVGTNAPTQFITGHVYRGR